MLHYVFNRLSPPAGLGELDTVNPFGTFTEQEARRLGISWADDSDDPDDAGASLREKSGKTAAVEVRELSP
ncbi:hypothetical protein KL924_005413 [Ogataea haglerorum]|nr:hypothetical protein KL924_005413 [Ogataea haglerorum]